MALPSRLSDQIHRSKLTSGRYCRCRAVSMAAIGSWYPEDTAQMCRYSICAIVSFMKTKSSVTNRKTKPDYAVRPSSQQKSNGDKTLPTAFDSILFPRYYWMKNGTTCFGVTEGDEVRAAPFDLPPRIVGRSRRSFRGKRVRTNNQERGTKNQASQ